MISIDDVERAAQTIAGRVHRTPLLRSATLSDRLGADAYLKAELFQRTGSFKVRGALNRIAELTDEERKRGVISISAGNHAQALAWAAREAGLDALIVMWQGADALKVAATRGYGAAIDQEAAGPTESFERLDELIAETGRTLVHPFNDEAVIAGQGTVALEILEEQQPDVVVVPVGGGGLVSGIATAVRARLPQARVIAVEPESSRALHDGLAAGHSVPVAPKSAADALNAPFAGERCDRDLLSARRRVGARLGGRAGRRVPLALRADEARVRARRRRLDGRASLRKGAARARRNGRRGRLGRQRGSPTGRCYPGS